MPDGNKKKKKKAQLPIYKNKFFPGAILVVLGYWFYYFIEVAPTCKEL